MSTHDYVVKILICYIFVKLMIYMPLAFAAIFLKLTDKDSK